MILRLSFYDSSKIVENFFKKKSLKNLQNEKTRIIFVVANEQGKGREREDEDLTRLCVFLNMLDVFACIRESVYHRAPRRAVDDFSFTAFLCSFLSRVVLKVQNVTTWTALINSLKWGPRIAKYRVESER